jgi:two-component sensor histidine kinase
MGGQECGQELCGRVVYLAPGRRRSSPPACPVGETAPPRIDDPSLLLQELTHRVCNEYSAAIAALSLICARTSNAEAKLALRAAEDRLHAYAAIHRAMQMPAGAQRIDLSRHLDNLCQVMSRSLLADRGIRLLLVEKRVELEPECCWRVGLIVSELVTNACKHAFIAGEGAIRVELSRQDGQVCCKVSDNGRATAAPRRGRGTEIVGALAAMLGGSVSWAFGSAGATVTLKFPDAHG